MSDNVLNDISKVYLEQIAVDEAVRGQDTEMRKAASAERRAGDTLTKKETQSLKHDTLSGPHFRYTNSVTPMNRYKWVWAFYLTKGDCATITSFAVAFI